MLSIGRLRLENGLDYYLDTVASGTEEYYTADREVPGRWIGSSEHLAGLDGEVSGEELRAVLEGRDPRTGKLLVSSRRTRAGLDLCFSPPKSMSLLFAFGDREMRRAVVAAHDSAVRAGLGYLEREACWVRRGHAGARRLGADGFIAAAFRHRTSRAGDPQLHTHVVVANMTRGEDGRWSALHTAALYGSARTAGYLYQAHLRHEIGQSLGVRWRPVVSGCAEMADIPAPVLREFSQRTDAIERTKAERGDTGWHGAEIATLATRPAKDTDPDMASLLREWEQRAMGLGFEPRSVHTLVGRAPRPGVERVNEGKLVDSLTLTSSTFDRPAVLRALAEQASGGATVTDIEAHADAILASEYVVRLDDDVYTTPLMLSFESAILDTARRRMGAGLGKVDPALVDEELHRRLMLHRDQAHMVRHLTSSGQGVDVVLGVAGAGKTTALECARSLWEASGHQTIGVALAARAAIELETRAGIPSCTLDSLLTELDGARTQLPPHTVIVVDEAAMVDTRRLARLVAHADRATTKVVLVGDPEQLPEIGAGGGFAGLVRTLPTVVLDEHRRQTDPIDRQAVIDLRRGDAAVAVERLAAHGRVAIADTGDEARTRMVDDWLAAQRAGTDTVMLASRRADADKLNQLARSRLVESGVVQRDGVLVNGREFAVGDRILALSNRRQLGLANGDRGSVTAVSDEGLVVSLDRGPTVALPGSYLRAGHLTYSYATTIHKAQGMTCDQTLVLANQALFREAGYTALSRGRRENRLYVVAPDLPDVDLSFGIRGERSNPLELLVSTLERSRAKHLALDQRMDHPAVDSRTLERGIDP
jgi:conjugative relaxase-like TrwC/TraI family protein